MRARIGYIGAALAIVVVVAILVPGAFAATHGGWKFAPTINAPWTGEDDQPFDSPIAAAGLCRSSPWSTSLAYDPPSLGEVDAITGDATSNSGFSNFGCATPQNETSAAVNPTNPQNVVAGANDYRVCCDFIGLNDGSGWAYYSSDGGATWGNVQVPGLTAGTGGQGVFKKMDSAGDPALAFGPDGTAYYANIVFSRVSPATGVAVSASTDGGRTWSAPNMVAYTDTANYFYDKEWIGAGAGGRVVVTWTRFSLGPHGAGYLASPIVMALSRDRGHSWNRQGSAVSDPTHPYDQGSQVQYGPDGALYVAYEAAAPTTGYQTDVTVLARSTDDGLTWSAREIGRVYDDLNCYPMYGGRQTLSDEHFRLNSYPSLSVDAVSGKLWVVWADERANASCGGSGSFAGSTSNQVISVSGTWSILGSPTAVTTSTSDKVFPSVSAYNSKVAITYYTRDYAFGTGAAGDVCHFRTNDAGGTTVTPSPSANNVCLDYAGVSSPDGGTSWSSSRRLTSQGSNPFVQFANGAFIGDYSQVAVGSDGTAHAVWTDFRGRPGTTSANQDVYVSTFLP